MTSFQRGGRGVWGEFRPAALCASFQKRQRFFVSPYGRCAAGWIALAPPTRARARGAPCTNKSVLDYSILDFNIKIWNNQYE